MMQGRNCAQQLTVSSMLLGRDRQKVQRPLLAQTLPVDRYKKLRQNTQRMKIKKQARENQLEEAPEKLCLHHGKIREDV